MNKNGNMQKKWGGVKFKKKTKKEWLKLNHS